MKDSEKFKTVRLWVLLILGCAAMLWGYAMM